VADFSTGGSECTTVVQVLDGQTCIDELLPETDGIFGMTPPELPLPDANGSKGDQLRLF